MKFNLDIKVTLQTSDEKKIFNFSDEHLEISRTSELWVQNLSDQDSELISNVKLWNDIDRATGITSRYIIETSEMTPIGNKTIYVVKRINEEQQAIVFQEWS